MQHIGCNGRFAFDTGRKRANSYRMRSAPRTNWILIAALFIAGLFMAAQFGKLTLTLELMQTTYPSASAWVPSLISIVGIVGLIFGVVAGPIIAGFGLRRAMLIGLLTGAAMSLIQAALPPISIFALTRIVEGFSHLSLVIAAPTLIAMAATEKDRPVAMGIWASFFGAGFALIAYLLPYILTTGGLPFLFALHGVGMITIAAVLWGLLPAVPPDPVEITGFFASYKTLYTTPNLALPGAGFVWYTALYIALIGVLPIALSLPTSVIAAIPLISIAGTLGAGVLAKFMPPQHVLSAGFVAAIALMSVIWSGLDGPVTLYLLFFFMGAIPTGAFASIAHFNQTTVTRAQATGGITHFGNVGTTLGTPIMVLAFQAGGMMGITLMVVLCSLGGLVSIALISQRLK